MNDDRTVQYIKRQQQPQQQIKTSKILNVKSA